MSHRNRTLAPLTLVAAMLVACPLAVGEDKDTLCREAKRIFALPAAPAEQLVVFVSSESSAPGTQFHDETLPKIRTLATEMKVAVRVIDVAGGAPAEIAITPTIVFQNHLGRSMYSGRYTGIDRIRNFVRTSRVVAQSDERLTKQQLPVWRIGRARVGAPVKISPVTGTRPPGYDNDVFQAEMRKTIFTAFKRFGPAREIDIGRQDRLFYMDFNPWVSDDGTLYLSVALFSQFHCKEPVFEEPGEAFRGPWSQRESRFRRAAVALEDAVVRAMRTSTIGDGFDAIPETTPTVSWESLDLALPPAPTGAASSRTGPALSRDWVVESPANGAAPQVVFRFAPPVDSYSGEAAALRGEIHLGKDNTLARAEARFEVPVTSVTMGDPDLDHTILSTQYLNAAKFPTAAFTTTTIDSERGRPTYGTLTPITMTGTFTMMGVSIPVAARAMLEPVVGDDGRPRLLLRGGFDIRLTPFQLEGPEGPEPAKDTLLFDFNVTLAPR